MAKRNPFKCLNTSPEIIRLVVMLYVRFPLSLRNVEDLLHERGINISHESVRFWWNRFGPLFAADIRRKRVSRMRAHSNWQWHLDEVFVKINGETHYLWRAVDHEGEVLESIVTKSRDRKAALRFIRKSMKRFGQPEVIVTDKLRSYGAVMNTIGNAERQQSGRWINNRAENSHPLPDSGLLANHEKGPFRRRERACSGSGRCEVYKSSPPFIPQSTTISIKSAIYTQAITSNSTAPLLSMSGVSFVRHRFRPSAANRDWFELVWQLPADTSAGLITLASCFIYSPMKCLQRAVLSLDIAVTELGETVLPRVLRTTMASRNAP